VIGAQVLELINRSREGGTAARVWPVRCTSSSNRGVLLFRSGTRSGVFEISLLTR